MQTSFPPEKSGIRPYATDIEYLMAEVEWIRIRSERIEAFRLLHTPDDAPLKLGSRRNRDLCMVASADRVTRLEVQESALRQEIDARVALNRNEGPGLGLDRLCLDFGLNDVERTTLLLGFVPSLGTAEFINSVSRVDAITTSSFLSYELVSAFLELDPDWHLQGLLSLLPDAALRAKWLVRMTYDPSTPSDAVGVGIELTGQAVAAMTGIAAFRGFAAPVEKGDA